MEGGGVLSTKEEEEVLQLGIRSLFEKANMRIITIVLLINWMFINVGYYGISLSSGSLSENIFLSFFLVSLIGK